jgi:signal transduction histidine kinase
MIEMTQRSDLELLQEMDRKTILIVDNEPVIRELCSKVLTDYNVVEASDGEQALRIFMEGGIDVILTDVRMPKLDGLELLSRLKEQEPTVVVIMMTGYADKELILKALKADADDFIIKPPNLLQLKSMVHKALVKKALKEEIASLKRLDRFKTNFLSLVSHKFRTPITSISLFLQNLSAGVCDLADPATKEALDLIYRESCYLGTLVSDLLAFSTVMDSGGTPQLAPLSLNALLPQLFEASKEWKGRPELTRQCQLEPVPELMLDREKIAFALQQVIDNAIKFSKKGGLVSIGMRNLGDSCRIVVEDQGIGMTAEQLPKVFEKFYQVDAERTGQVRGFGLGLFYARDFIRMHGGSIGIESEFGVGSRVTITLPYRTGASA